MSGVRDSRFVSGSVLLLVNPILACTFLNAASYSAYYMLSDVAHTTFKSNIGLWVACIICNGKPCLCPLLSLVNTVRPQVMCLRKCFRKNASLNQYFLRNPFVILCFVIKMCREHCIFFILNKGGNYSCLCFL